MITAEALAQSWHNHSELHNAAEAAALGVTMRMEPWDELTDKQRKMMVQIAEQTIDDILFYPAKPGEPGPGDEGPTAILVSSNREKGLVRVDFGVKLKWFAFPKDQAMQFALLILQHCGIPIAYELQQAAGIPPAPGGNPNPG